MQKTPLHAPTSVFSPEADTYDLDGNLLTDGAWTYTWDAENRLTSMYPLAAIETILPAASRKRIDYRYDYLGRRVRKTVQTWNGSAYVTSVDRKFIYDGWNLLSERDATTLSVVANYVWGLDLSKTLQDGGGVGGLLAVLEPNGTTHLTAYDGNGNVAALVNKTTGAITAAYEYDAFGQTIRATGAMSATNPFRFSTKYTDSETGLLYYGRRYYNPQLGRWVGRDPIEEKGGLHLYGFVGNNGVNRWDMLGMFSLEMDGSGSSYDPIRMSPFKVAAYTFEEFVLESALLQLRLNAALNYRPYQIQIEGPGTDEIQNQIDKAVRCSPIRNNLNYARAADDVYENRTGGRAPNASNLERMTNEQLAAKGVGNPGSLINDETGFYSAVYYDHNNGSYIYSIRGTEPSILDIATDIFQPIGLFAGQYQNAAAAGLVLGSAFQGNITGTGHSLGGGLITVAALRGSFNAVTINTAGVGSTIAKDVGVDLDGAPGSIDDLSVPGDFLSRGLNRLPLVPGGAGSSQGLPSPGGLPNPLSRHSIKSAITALKNQLTSNGCN